MCVVLYDEAARRVFHYSDQTRVRVSSSVLRNAKIVCLFFVASSA